MSTKNNALVQVAAVALNMAVSQPMNPVVEGLLNDFNVGNLYVAQIDEKGRCVVLAQILTETGTPGIFDSALRPVCSSSGDVRVYTNIGAVQGLIKRVKLAESATVTIKRMQSTSTIGDPIAALKKLYLSFKKEKLASEKAMTAITAKIAAGTALGWDTQTGTPEAVEFDDYEVRENSVSESIEYCEGRITALAASLTAAGIDPLTVV